MVEPQTQPGREPGRSRPTASPTPSAIDRRGLATVGVRALRNSVSSLVRRAEQGERIIITVDGRPRAQLGPLTPDGGSPTLDDLAAAGLIEPPSGQAGGTFPVPLAVPADVRLDRLLDQIRGR